MWMRPILNEKMTTAAWKVNMHSFFQQRFHPRPNSQYRALVFVERDAIERTRQYMQLRDTLLVAHCLTVDWSSSLAVQEESFPLDWDACWSEMIGNSLLSDQHPNSYWLKKSFRLLMEEGNEVVDGSQMNSTDWYAAHVLSKIYRKVF